MLAANSVVQRDLDKENFVVLKELSKHELNFGIKLAVRLLEQHELKVSIQCNCILCRETREFINSYK